MSGTKRIFIGEVLSCKRCSIEKNAAKDFYWYSSHGIKYPKYSCKECFKELARDWRSKNPEKAAIQGRKWGKKNPHLLKVCYDRYNKKNLDRGTKFMRTPKGRALGSVLNAKRRARVMGSICDDSNLVDRDWFLSKCISVNNVCVYCLASDKSLTLDHIIPISRGGMHVRENIIPSCKPCNSSKKNNLISEWRPWIDIPVYGLELASA